MKINLHNLSSEMWAAMYPFTTLNQCHYSIKKNSGHMSGEILIGREPCGIYTTDSNLRQLLDYFKRADIILHDFTSEEKEQFYAVKD